MKKYLFLLILPILFLLPKDTFAKTTVDYMVIYSPNYEHQISCNNCQYLENFSPTKLADRVGFRFGQTLIKDITYTITFSFDTYYSMSTPTYHEFGFYGPGSLGNVSVSRSNPVYVEWMNAYQIRNTASLTWTQGQNVDTFAAELYFVPSLYLLQVNVVDWTLTAQGQDNNDVTINSSQNIMDNQDKNTDRIIESNKEIIKEQEKTNDELEDLNDSITSEDPPNLDSLNDSAGWLPAGPVDSILNLPLSLFQNLTDNLSKSCQPVIANLPYVNQTITLPCISTLYAKMGLQDFLNWVGVVVGALILYNYFLKLYQWVDDTLTFRENNWQDWGGV